MPIYEYRCEACGFEQEFLQKLSDAPISECPTCGKAAMTKLVSAAGFQLKGTGWYATDFKNSGAKPAKTVNSENANSASDSSGSAAGESKSGEAKTGETKAETAPACGAGACPACQ